MLLKKVVRPIIATANLISVFDYIQQVRDLYMQKWKQVPEKSHI
jgi:hypothetical protein